MMFDISQSSCKKSMYNYGILTYYSQNFTKKSYILVLVPMSAKQCNLKCKKIYQPVCGSNGQKYDNLCQMKQAACIQKEVVVRVSWDKCSDEAEPPKVVNIKEIMIMPRKR